MVSSIVRVIRGHGSWPALPAECGKWETAYKRYQLWRAEGRWQRIAAALGIEDREVALWGALCHRAGENEATRWLGETIGQLPWFYCSCDSLPSNTSAWPG